MVASGLCDIISMFYSGAETTVSRCGRRREQTYLEETALCWLACRKGQRYLQGFSFSQEHATLQDHLCACTRCSSSRKVLRAVTVICKSCTSVHNGPHTCTAVTSGTDSSCLMTLRLWLGPCPWHCSTEQWEHTDQHTWLHAVPPTGHYAAYSLS